MVAAGLWHELWRALSFAAGMTWEILWALVLGFLLSAIVQARPVAMVEADREAREIRGDAGGKHPRNPIGEGGRLSC